MIAVNVICTGRGRHADSPHYYLRVTGPNASIDWQTEESEAFDSAARRVSFDLHRNVNTRSLIRRDRVRGHLPQHGFLDGASFTAPTRTLVVEDTEGEEHITYLTPESRTAPWSFRCPSCDPSDVRPSAERFQVTIDRLRRLADPPPLDTSYHRALGWDGD